jgi:serine/threonine-protein kinase
VLAGAGAAALVLVLAAGGLWWRHGHSAKGPEPVVAEAPSTGPVGDLPPDPGPVVTTKEQPATTATQPPVQKTEPASTPPPAVAAAPAESGPAQKAAEVLTKYCYRCHGENGSKEGGFSYVLDQSQLLARKKVLPGDAAGSKLFKKVKRKEMPPPDEVTDPNLLPTDADVAALEKWIQAGAPPFPAATKAVRGGFITTKEMLTAIRDHLRNKVRSEDRPFQRYYSLTHLYNNPKVPPEKLPLYRAALSKLVNSLSWGEAMVLPTQVDAEGTIYAVDLRRLGWDGKLWQSVLEVYPYGMTYDTDADEGMRDLAKELAFLSGTPLPYLRADWFVATASRPPLYHTLLRLPNNARDIETFLGVDLERHFQNNTLVRAGFVKSGVSNNNRLVERHDARYGAYWRSYDFKSNEGTSNLLKFPLGPSFAGNSFLKQAFEQAGGELIWNLPNGLQGYLLIDAKDKRIEKGPPDVVSDLSQSSGTTEIVTGLSCMGCHKQGMISDGWRDEVRASRTVTDQALIKVQQLFVEKDDMDKLLKQDEKRFMDALDLATGSFLKVGADRTKDIRDFTEEPTTAIAKVHLKAGVGPEEVACELGIADPKVLQEAIRTNATLREKLGMGPLVQGNTIKRDAWESLAERSSPFQQAAEELRLGKPFRPAAQQPAAATAEQPPAAPAKPTPTVTVRPTAPAPAKPPRTVSPPSGEHPYDLPPP